MDFDELFTKDKPVIFAFHTYPWLIHRLTYHRPNRDNIHVRGYKEVGSDSCISSGNFGAICGRVFGLCLR